MSNNLDANLTCMEVFVDALAAGGLRQAVISPGSRSTPITLALVAHPDIECIPVVDERSAAFIALGAAKATGRPAAVVCTSGTAAANFHPAVIEADLARVALVALTADRPPELHGRGAPQTVRQDSMYGPAVRQFTNAGVPDLSESVVAWYSHLGSRAADSASRPIPGPVHVNFAFREPLATRLARPADTAERRAVVVHTPTRQSVLADHDLPIELADTERGLIVCGWSTRTIDDRLGDAVAALAAATGWPVVADTTGAVRFGTSASRHCVDGVDLIARHKTSARRLSPDLVIRVGGWPISRPIGRLISSAQRHVLIAPDGWSDPNDSVTDIVRSEPDTFLSALADHRRHPPASDWRRDWTIAEKAVEIALSGAFDETPELDECRLAREVVARSLGKAVFCLASSMALRDADAFAQSGSERLEVVSNRGANGIDGFVSTCIGAGWSTGKPVIALCGDVALAHDGLALHISTQRQINVTFVVPNNMGGAIFSFLPQAELGLGDVFDEYFTVSTRPGPDVIAAGSGADHRVAASPDELAAAIERCLAHDGPDVVEVPSDTERSVAVHSEIVANTALALEAIEWPS